MKNLLKALAMLITVVVIAAVIYVAYVLIAYHRLDDNVTLDVLNVSSEIPQGGATYSITTFNLGFGAYSRDYSFFMDGGENSRAYDRETAIANINGAAAVIAELDPDFAFFQEVDTDATRSYQVDEYVLLSDVFPGDSSVLALNYDSPYLFYPLTEPIGRSVSGIVTFAGFCIKSSLRRSLPIETGFRKLLDLDRCYSVTRIPTSNGKDLVLINLHLSAYTEDETIGEAQLAMLFEDAEAAYKTGNYVIIGGDFNKDVLGDSPQLFGTTEDVPSWALPLNKELIPSGFIGVRPENGDDIWPTVRDCETGYVEGVTFVSAVDGFIVSDNIDVIHEEIINAGFTYTDHNPVLLEFALK